MSYERYKDYRLAPDDNGCWDVLTGDTYEQQGTYPSKAAAKRAIDNMTASQPPPDMQELRDAITAIKRRRDYHLMDEPEYVDAIMELVGEAVQKQDDAYEAEMLKLIDERDSLGDRLDSLADAVAAYFNIDIGEHSSMNDPWYNAFEFLRDNTARPPQEGQQNAS